MQGPSLNRDLNAPNLAAEWAKIIHGTFEANSGSCVRERTTGGFNFCFQEVFTSIGEVFILAGGLGTGLSFYGV